MSVAAARGSAPDAVQTTPTLRRVLLVTTRSEWTKLRTVRSTVWALLLTVISIVGLGALITALEASRWDTRSPAEVAGFDPLLYSLAGISLAQPSVGVLGVLVMTSEYATGIIGLTLAATPQRRLLLAAKVATFCTVVAVVGLVSCVAAFFIGQSLLGPQHAGVSISDPGVLRAVTGGAMRLVLIGAIAVGLGAAMRRTAEGVAVLVAVLLVLPGLVTLLPSPWNDDITKFLPGSAGTAMSAVLRFPSLLSPWAGLLVLSAYATATLIVAGTLLAHRDA